MITDIEFENIRKLAMNAAYNNKDVINNKISCKDINIICGRNGSGKSTILDMIRGVINDDILKTLPRENMDDKSIAKLKIKNDGILYKYLFKSKDLKKHSITKPEDSFNSNICYYNNNPNDYISCRDFAKIINESIFLHDKLLGFYKDPVKENVFSYNTTSNKNDEQYNISPIEIDENSECDFHIKLNDDDMYNVINFDYIPSGWKQIANIIYFLKKQKDESICLLDEPEVHLHPELQRILINQVIKIQKEKKLQIFIATHSTIFIDPLIWEESNSVSLLVSDGYGVSDLIEPAKVLSELGIKPSDIFQSEGIIWVEGPSDRIYIKHWLDLYHKGKKDKKYFKENIHFSFLLYGGSLMKYYSESSSCKNDTIIINKINENSLFIFDKDAGNESYKNNVKNSGLDILSTHGYTVEDYLPKPFFDEYFYVNDGKTKLKNDKKRKVDIAKKFCSKSDTADDFEAMMKDESFKQFIEHIYCSIEKWNRV